MIKNKTEIVAFITVFFVIICYQWFFTAGKMAAKWPRGTSYYELQARAFSNGQLHLLELPEPELLALADPYDPTLNSSFINKSNDLALYNGKYYLNWGPVPALIISVLHLMFASKTIYDSFVVFGFFCGLLLSNALLVLWLKEHLFTQLSGWVVVLAILLTGLSHPIPWLLSRPAIYEAAIVAGQFFLISGLYWGVSALARPYPDFWKLLLAGISWSLVIGTRISLLIVVSFFTVTFVYMIFRQSQKQGCSNTFVLAVACVMVPLLLGLLLLGFYNYYRFGSFFETGVQYTLTGGLNQHVLAQERKLVSGQYALPNLINYLTNEISLQSVFPYLVALPGKLPPKQIPNFRLEVIAGIVWVLPFALFSFVPVNKFIHFVLRKNLLRNRNLLRLIANDEGSLNTYLPFLLAGGAFFTFLPLLTFFAATMRYEADFVPLLLLLSIWGFWSILKKYSDRSIVQRRIKVVGTILSLTSLMMAFLLGITSYHHHFETQNPELLYRIRNFLALTVNTPYLITSHYESITYYEQADLIWQGKQNSLWKWRDQFRVYLIGIQNPNGLEVLEDGKRFFWLGGEPSNFELSTSHGGLIELSLQTVPGPSLPGVEERHLDIILPDGSRLTQTVLPGITTLDIPVVPGRNTVVIEVIDAASLPILPNGDMRTLLLGIQGMNIRRSK